MIFLESGGETKILEIMLIITLASHIFGYVSEINDAELEKKKAEGYKSGDIVGKFGLEKVYDKELRGVDGGGQVEVDVTGVGANSWKKRTDSWT